MNPGQAGQARSAKPSRRCHAVVRTSVRAALLAWCLSGFVAMAQQSDAGALNLEADSIRYDNNTGKSVYRGNVVISRADMRLTGDEVEVFSEGGEFSRIIANARPCIFQSHSADGNVDAEANRIEYDVKHRRVVFVGEAKVDDGEKVLRGGRIVYDLNKRVVDATKSEGRVRLTIDHPVIPEKSGAR